MKINNSDMEKVKAEGKICTFCKKYKPVDSFYSNIRSRDKHSHYCKECSNMGRKMRYRKTKKEEDIEQRLLLKRKKKRKAYDKRYYQKHKEELNAYNKKYQENHKEGIKVRKKLYYQNNKEESKAYGKKYYHDHKGEIEIRHKKYIQDHKEERNRYVKTYREEHKEEKNSKRREKYEIDPDPFKKICAERQRRLGYIPLNNRFEGCEGHHIDNECVIHIPKELHKSIRHNLKNGSGMFEINQLALNFLKQTNLLNV